jgi:restriction system protein
MGKKGAARQGLDLVAELPWPWGVGFAIASWWALHSLAGSAALVSKAIGTVFQWIVPPLLLVAALASCLRARKSVALLNTTLNEEILRTLSWREFERLLFAAFEAHGFDVQDRGGYGADGGADLVAKRGDQKYYVQCKHWKTQQVGVNVVRELAGIVATNGVAGGYVVASGRYTREAQEFGVKAGLQLLDGPQLLEFLEEGRRRGQHSRETGADSFAKTSERHSRRIRIAVALAVFAVTAAFWIGSDTPDMSPNENTAQKSLPRHPMSPAQSKPAALQDAPLVDPVDLENRRAEGRQVAVEAAKAAAWAAEWKVSPECEDPVDWAAQVECGNRYIRAKRAFDERWNTPPADGKLLSPGE